MDQPNPSAVHDGGNRRPVILAIIAALLLVVGLVSFIRSRQNDDPKISSDVTASAYPTLIDGLCATKEAALSGERTTAYNTFYARSHYALHILVADVLDRDRTLAGRIQRAKSNVEQDLSTFSPGLAAEMDPLITAAAEGLQLVAPGDDTIQLVCAG